MSEVFNPSWPDDRDDRAPSSLCVVELPLPMGMIIEDSATLDGKIEVAEVKPDSNAEKAGIRPGDVLRALSAQKLQPPAMGMAQEQVKVRKAMFVCDGNGFSSTMSALASNAEANSGSGRVALVLERRCP